MAFNMTVYYQDEHIERTTLDTSFVQYTGYYGDSEYHLGGATYCIYRAYPASGCVFSHWVYRYVVNGVQSSQYTSTANPFSYDGSKGDLIIRAVGEEEYVEPSDSWELSSYNLGSISALKSTSISLSSYTLYRYKVSFANEGTAKFYTEGTSADTYGFLSTSTGWDSENGTPSSPLKEDDDTNGAPNFFISYNVTAGTTYYIWVRGYSGSTTGSTTLYIEPPEPAAVRPSNFSWTYTKTSGGAFNLTATEWNNFTARVNAFRKYKSLSNYSFTYAYKGDDFTAAMYNQARIAIQGVSGYGTYIPTVTKGQIITAYMLNVLVSELNSIP